MESFGEAAGKAGSEALIPNHYSPTGNRLVAETISRYLEKEHLLDGPPRPRGVPAGGLRDPRTEAAAGSRFPYTRGEPGAGSAARR